MYVLTSLKQVPFPVEKARCNELKQHHAVPQENFPQRLIDGSVFLAPEQMLYRTTPFSSGALRRVGGTEGKREERVAALRQKRRGAARGRRHTAIARMR